MLLGLDQPCRSTWTPRTCRGYDQRSPVDHRCRVPRAYPHVCVCWCGHTDAGRMWLVARSPVGGHYVRPATLGGGAGVGS